MHMSSYQLRYFANEVSSFTPLTALKSTGKNWFGVQIV